MSRFLLRFTGILMFNFVFLTGGSILTGNLLLPPASVVFLSAESNDQVGQRLVISRIDTRQHITHIQRLPYRSGVPRYIDNHCRILLPVLPDDQMKLVLMELASGGKPRVLFDFGANDSNPHTSWLPDERHIYLAYTSDTGYAFRLIDTTTGTAVPLDLKQAEGITTPVILWSPDSTYGLVYDHPVDSANPAPVYLLDVATGSISAPVLTTGQEFYWSPDSRYIAALDRNHQRVELIDARTLTLHQHQFAEINPWIGARWTPDNRLLFLARQSSRDTDFQGYAWQTGTAQPEKIALKISAGDFLTRNILHSGWSPDASKLYYEDRQDRIHILEAPTGTEIGLTSLPEKLSFTRGAWSADSRYLIIYVEVHPTLLIFDTVSQQRTILPVENSRLRFKELLFGGQVNLDTIVFDSQ